MREIICDPLAKPSRRRYGRTDGRFTGGITLKCIVTNSELVDKEYICTDYRCLATVKGTSENFYYMVPPTVDLDKLKTWISEVSPNFPTLDIKVISKEEGKFRVPKADVNNSMDIREPVTLMRLKISNRAHELYCYTVPTTSEYGHFFSYDPLIERFVDYLESVTDKGEMLTEDILLECVNSFVANRKNSIIRLFTNRRGSDMIMIHMDCDVSRSSRGLGYTVDPYYTIDEHYLADNIDIVGKYLSELVKINIGYFKTLLASRGYGMKTEVPKLHFVQALYSLKTYPLESYLANHLIRAGLSSEFDDFISQYFMIKEKHPDIFFWKRILMTQFGFEYYYYYWLTNARTFRDFTEQEFYEKAKKAGPNSSQYFFREFEKTVLPDQFKIIAKMYKQGDFLSVIEGYKTNMRARLKPSRKGKLAQLLILDEYEVLLEEDNKYYIKGDNFLTKAYSKSNFQKV